MKISSPPQLRLRLAQLASHIVIALIALIVIGGATRVMDAGLACPDWPLCYGTLLPGRQMNLQVFLEWFHRLDAFLVGISLLIQFAFSLLWRANLPPWLPWAYGGLTLLVFFQGVLGAFTVLHLLPSAVVIAHLIVALILVAAMSGINQRLLCTGSQPSPLWWRFSALTSLLAVIGQSLLGSRMATSWAAQRCINQGELCELLDLHRITAIPVTFLVLTFVISSLLVGGWARSQWPLLLPVLLLMISQVFLGIFSVRFSLNEPLLTIGHQMFAALLVAFLAALSAKNPIPNNSGQMEVVKDQTLEPCHG